MSQEDVTSVLLPASRVDFHTLDEGTTALAKQPKTGVSPASAST
jgi:hypothetical protein